MLRVLACIPHYFRRNAEDSGVINGSNTDTPASRSIQMGYCLRNLVAILESSQFILGSPNTLAMESVRQTSKTVSGSVILVTVPENNLLDLISTNTVVDHEFSEGSPRELGYHCRRTFARFVGQYDYYLFIEDDTALLDPRFFQKVAAFHAAFGEGKIVQPNRFELVGRMDGAWRAYLDMPAFPQHRSPEREGPATLALPSYGGDVIFEKTTDAISGCYVISDSQLRQWMTQPHFDHPDPKAIAAGHDPLELTQIALGGTLPIYRPLGQDMNFLEVHHVPNRLSNAKTPKTAIRDIVMPLVDARVAARTGRQAQGSIAPGDQASPSLDNHPR